MSKCTVPGCRFVSKTHAGFVSHQKYEDLLEQFGTQDSAEKLKQRNKALLTGTPYICCIPGCNYSCVNLNVLEDHHNMHLGIKPHKCQFCDHRTSFARNLKRHIEDKHKKKVVHLCIILN